MFAVCAEGNCLKNTFFSIVVFFLVENRKKNFNIQLGWVALNSNFRHSVDFSVGDVERLN